MKDRKKFYAEIGIFVQTLLKINGQRRTDGRWILYLEESPNTTGQGAP